MILCVMSVRGIVHTNEMAQCGKMRVTAAFASTLDQDVISVILSFSRDRTVLELYKSIRAILKEKKRLIVSMLTDYIHLDSVWDGLVCWAPGNAWPFPLAEIGCAEMTNVEKQRTATALRWLKWSRRRLYLKLMAEAAEVIELDPSLSPAHADFIIELGKEE